MLRVHFISVIFIVINNVSIVYFYFHIAVYSADIVTCGVADVGWLCERVVAK